MILELLYYTSLDYDATYHIASLVACMTMENNETAKMMKMI